MAKQKKKILKTDDKQKVVQKFMREAFNVYLHAVKKVMPKFGISTAKMPEFIREMEHTIAEMAGDETKRTEYLYDYTKPEHLKVHLNIKDRFQFIKLSVALQSAKELYDDWSREGNLKPEEKKYLKTGHTYLTKALILIQTRFQEREKDLQRRLLEKKSLVLLDNKKDAELIKDLKKQEYEVRMSGEQFKDFLHEVVNITCRNCTRDYKNCELYKNQFELEVDPLGYYNSGCPYKHNFPKDKEVKR